MHVLIDCLHLRNKHTGIDTYTVNLLGNIASQPDARFTVLLDSRYERQDVLGLVDRYPNVRLFRVFCRFPLIILYTGFLVPFYLFFKKVDIYHGLFFFGPLLRFICPHTKVVITVHDLFYRSVPHLLTKRNRLVARYFAEPAIIKADAVIVMSENTRRDILKYLEISPDKIHLIYMASRNFKPANISATVKNDGNGEEPFFLVVGWILPRKGLDDLISAMVILQKEKRLPERIYLAGHITPYKEVLMERVEQLCVAEGTIRFLGYVTDEELARLYRTATAMVFPSYYEGFGFPVLEAMQIGCPTIVRNASSLSEVAGDAALLFSTTEELADAMNTLSSDKEQRRQLIMRGLRQAQSFSWKTCADSTMKVYHNLN